MDEDRHFPSRTAALGLCVLGLAACSTPGLDYTARVPAGDPVVQSYRAVEVAGFSGPQGAWYARQFEAMLAGASLDGAQWFEVGGYSPVEGVFDGDVQVDWVDEFHDREIVRKCVEWDGIFDCERRADVVRHCVSFSASVSVRPRLIDAARGEVVWRDVYHGHAEEEVCEDLGEIGHSKGRRTRTGSHRHSYPFYGLYGGYVVDDLIREAFAETLSDIRRDVAPRNVRSKARLIDEAVHPEARFDPRFGQAIEAAKKDNHLTACVLFEDLAKAYPDAPAVRFNLGACAEASGDFERAQLIYAEVSGLFPELPETVADALGRINARRAGEAELDALIQPQPEGWQAYQDRSDEGWIDVPQR